MVVLMLNMHLPSTHCTPLNPLCSTFLPPPPFDPRWQVKNYFNTDGFNRWQKIYGETDEVNKVQLDIRQGHAQTVEKVLGWLDAEGGVAGTSVADAGCGTGGEAVYCLSSLCVEVDVVYLCAAAQLCCWWTRRGAWQAHQWLTQAAAQVGTRGVCGVAQSVLISYVQLHGCG
jgi:hypothetical protein